MGNWLSLQQYIPGDSSGNTSSNNTVDSFNTTNNHYHDCQKRETSENWAEVLQQLYPPGSGYESHRRRVPKPVGGTCTWVTGHPKYQEWLENKTSGLLWLSADPGCGKSVIASFLVGHLAKKTSAIVCYFFFKDDSEEQNSVTFALRSILHQLFVQRPNLCTYAQEAIMAKGSRFTEQADTLWNILVKAVSDRGCGDVICVVDALDECEAVTITLLIRHLTGLRESQPSGIPLKFLVTSRPYHRIERELGLAATTIRLKGEAEVEAITSDVTRVINDGIKKLEAYWGQEGRLEYLRDLLKSSADRTFLWVSLVLEILKDSQDDSPEEFTKIVTTAPHDLAQFYTKILDKSTCPVKARRILNIVVAAARPLTLREMNIAFKIRPDHTTIKDLAYLSPGFEKTVKNLCGLFVRVIDSKIYLIHHTAREFLIDRSSYGQGNWQYTLHSKDSNFIVAEICLSYLSLEVFENDPSLVATRSTAVSAPRNSRLPEHALLDYAATHWPSHFRDSQDRQMELFEFTRVICKRGSNRFLTWLKVFWRKNHHTLDGPFPYDFTHLMMASWLGQERAVERILGEGGDLNAESGIYGTALNVAALRREGDITKMLTERGIFARVSGERYNILKTKRSELQKVCDRIRSDIGRKVIMINQRSVTR